MLPQCRRHRDLQHIIKNLQGQAKVKLEHYDYWGQWLKDFLVFSAHLNRYMEFKTVWGVVLEWMENIFEEPEMAGYLRETILLEDEHGDFRCTWRHGLDVVPLGYITFVSNNIERGWRTVKGLLNPGYLVPSRLVDFRVQLEMKRKKCLTFRFSFSGDFMRFLLR